jgi:hypothetical protein
MHDETRDVDFKGRKPVTEIREGARRLVAVEPGAGDSSKHVAERATQACEQLADHMSRLLGETGVQMLFSRSVTIASAQIAWLRGLASTTGQPTTTFSALRAAMDQQPPESITEAFVAILSTLVGLLKRLIGDGLVDRLLSEVWPSVFVDEAKDTP